MRAIAYTEKYKLPIIDYVDNLCKLKIVGVQFLDDGTLALQCMKYDGRRNVDFLYMIPLGDFPADLEEAMQDREYECQRGENLFSMIAKPAIQRRIENQILQQDNAALWALGLDPDG